jgi:hypothetical protein
VGEEIIPGTGDQENEKEFFQEARE